MTPNYQKSTLAWRGLTEAEQKAAGGQALKAEIDRITKALFDRGTQLQRNKITTGGYSEAIEGVIAKMNREGQIVSSTSQAYSALLTSYQKAEAKARELILTHRGRLPGRDRCTQ